MVVFRLFACGRRAAASLVSSSWRRPQQRGLFACKGMKVTVCGAAGCTGQPLSLLLKQCPLIDEIALYDQVATCGFAVELSHVDTKPKISSYSGRHMLAQALQGSDVVVIVARGTEDTFEANAPIVTEITLQICNVCPNAFTIMATEPVESLTPLVYEIQRLRNVYRSNRLLGCIELHCVRANTVLADFLRVPPESVQVPIIGGASPRTLVPVLSSAVHPCNMTQEQVECVTSCIMNGNETICASKGSSTATPCLAGAFAIARVTTNVVKGLKGAKIPIHAYIDNKGAPGCQFFSVECYLGQNGIGKCKGIPDLTKFENCLLHSSLPHISSEQLRASGLVYTMCTTCCSPDCPIHPCTCYTQPQIPCVPPTRWGGVCPDTVKDEYLATICREMTCKCGSTELVWRPKDPAFCPKPEGVITCQGRIALGPCPSKFPSSIAYLIEMERQNKLRRPCPPCQ